MEIKNRLLKRQVKRAFGESVEISPELAHLLRMVEDSYLHLENDRKLLERSLEISSKESLETNASLKEANEELEDFNHSVSHDLKTHAVNVSALVTMLKKYLQRDDKNKLDQVVHQLEKSGEALSNIINGFLGISRLERSMQSDREIISLQTIINQILEEQHVLLEQNKVHVTVQNKEDRAYIATAHMETILRNLLTNAVKYRKPGVTPTIDIKTWKEGENTYLSVADNGIGIDLERNRYRLFKMFTRLENNQKVEGTGVGLFMVKKLLNRNRGEISVTSEVGKGSTFVLKLVR